MIDRAYIMVDGSIFREGEPQELAADQHVRAAYLGRNFELKPRFELDR